MKKRILSLALALALMMALALLPPAAMAAIDFVVEDGVLIEYQGPGGNVTIPNSVTAIGYYAFGDRGSLTAICGADGSYAQLWAIDNGKTFEAVLSPAATPGRTAYASTQTVNVDGKAVTFECYALKDASGNATNYIKLRDLAMLLGNSPARFQVGYDGSVTITTKTAYTPNGTELKTPFSGDRAYREATAATKVNDVAVNLAAFVLNDDAGGGYTYYQLRDLGKTLGFNVGWAAGRGMFIETGKPYDPAN